MRNKGLIGSIVSGVIIVGGLVTTLLITEKIPAGYVGVQYSINGGVSDELLTQGWHLVSPTKKVSLYSIATEQLYMSKDEREWLNNYHKDVYEKIGPRLTEEEREWLKEYTRAI